MLPDFDAKERAMYWHCRRGMKELDVILMPFMEKHYRQLAEEDQRRFALLLEQNDVDLLDWFLNRITPDDAELAVIVERVLSLHHDA